MQIQVNTSHNIEGRAALAAEVEVMVTMSLSHVVTPITRVEVHLSEENGNKRGQKDKRCVIEARLEGQQPTAVTCEAATLCRAVAGAANKLKSFLESTTDRLHPDGSGPR